MEKLLNEIHGYYINPDSFSHRRKDIEDVINNIGLKSVTRIAFNGKEELRCNTMTMAHITAVSKAIEDNQFPCIILEDDCQPIKPLPTSFEIPDECIIIYLGASSYYAGATKRPIRIEEWNNDYYRLFNSLSTHALLIPSLEAAKEVLKMYNQGFSKNMFNDAALAVHSENKVFLAPKGGNYFYQNDGHTKPITDFLWENFK